MSENEEDIDELEGERRSGVPVAEGGSDGGASRLLFNFLKCSSRYCISFVSVISDGGGGSWSDLISSCNFGREANPATKLDHIELLTVRNMRTLCQPQEGPL